MYALFAAGPAGAAALGLHRDVVRAPLFVGRARSLAGRLADHASGRTHFAAWCRHVLGDGLGVVPPVARLAATFDREEWPPALIAWARPALAAWIDANVAVAWVEVPAAALGPVESAARRTARPLLDPGIATPDHGPLLLPHDPGVLRPEAAAALAPWTALARWIGLLDRMRGRGEPPPEGAIRRDAEGRLGVLLDPRAPLPSPAGPGASADPAPVMWIASDPVRGVEDALAPPALSDPDLAATAGPAPAWAEVLDGMAPAHLLDAALVRTLDDLIATLAVDLDDPWWGGRDLTVFVPHRRRGLGRSQVPRWEFSRRGPGRPAAPR